MKTVLVMAGGTGGHIFPALTVADHCYAKGINIYWLGSVTGMEKDLIPDRYPMTLLDIKGVRGKGLKRKLKSIFYLLKAITQAVGVIKKVKPDVVLGMGGFASGPGGVAAWLMRVPLVIHEQNAIAGYTNRMLSRFSSSVLSAFEGAFPLKTKVKVIGNPVRQDIANIPVPEQRLKYRKGPFRILILGGSQGAQAINDVMLACLEQWSGDELPLVWHQAGKEHFEEVKRQYQLVLPSAIVEDFISDMAPAYEWADIVIGRAGALTVSEIAAVGVASILIPFPHAVDDHQYHNARLLEQQGGAVIIRQQQCTAHKLQEALSGFMNNREKLIYISEANNRLEEKNVSAKIVATCEHFFNKKRGLS